MGRAKKSITRVITTTMIITIIALLFYLDWSRRTDSQREASVDHKTEVEKLLERDLILNYPETPREVTKLYSNFLKELYSGIEDEDVEALAIKVRQLYDEEFLKNNPEDKYLKDLYSEIAAWNEDERKITNYVLVNEDLEEKKSIDRREYATVFASYTITEKGKVPEVRKYLLRLSEDYKWKILGWEIIHQDDEK